MCPRALFASDRQATDFPGRRPSGQPTTIPPPGRAPKAQPPVCLAPRAARPPAGRGAVARAELLPSSALPVRVSTHDRPLQASAGSTPATRVAERAGGNPRMAMIAAERRAATGLAGIYALRMLGLFILLPVLALAGRDLDGATPLLIGLALGIYGLTQALLQVPFGLLSDRFGRKRIILAGLLLFTAGSVICALSDSIWGVILGRALQGSGAIAAALMALAADLTRDAVRTRVMAVIGISIGLAFSVSLFAGPLVEAWIGLAGLFWLTAAFAVLAIVVLYTIVPDAHARQPQHESSPVPAQLLAVLRHRELLRLDLGIFALHCIMTATFVVLPVVLESAGLPGARHWEIYLPVLAASVAVMGPLIVLGERPGRARPVFLAAIALIVLAQLGLVAAGGQLFVVAVLLLLFFSGFNVLEATLPAHISRLAPAAHKGTAMGVYSSAQFLGAFAGGVLAGALQQFAGIAAVFGALAAIAVAWLLVSRSMPRAIDHASVLVRLDGRGSDGLADRLAGLDGVEEAVVVAEEGVAYLKVDRQRFDPGQVEALGVRVSG